MRKQINYIVLILSVFLSYGCGGSSEVNNSVEEISIKNSGKSEYHDAVDKEGFFDKKINERPTKYITINPVDILKLGINDYINMQDSYDVNHKFKIISKKLIDDEYRYFGYYSNESGDILSRDLELLIYVNEDNFNCSFTIKDGTKYICYTGNINGKNYGIVTKADDFSNKW